MALSGVDGRRSTGAWLRTLQCGAGLTICRSPTRPRRWQWTSDVKKNKKNTPTTWHPSMGWMLSWSRCTHTVSRTAAGHQAGLGSKHRHSAQEGASVLPKKAVCGSNWPFLRCGGLGRKQQEGRHSTSGKDEWEGVALWGTLDNLQYQPPSAQHLHQAEEHVQHKIAVPVLRYLETLWSPPATRLFNNTKL